MKFKKLIALGIGAFVLLVVGVSSIRIVPYSHTGIVKTFGAVQDYTYNEGLHIVAPFITTVDNLDNRIFRSDIEGQSASKDLQTVKTVISVNYDVPAASSIQVYKKVGKGAEEIILKPAVQEAVKAVVSKYTAEELITKRAAVSDDIQTTLSNTANTYGINIDKVNIINFDFSEEFNAAIEAKQTAQQQALKAEQDLARVKVEAEQQIAKAQAEAESYKLKNQQITDANIRMAWIEKWDGKLPETMAGDSTTMLMLNPSSSKTSQPAQPAQPQPTEPKS